jgi:hypothetical protein
MQWAVGEEKTGFYLAKQFQFGDKREFGGGVISA